MRGREIRLNHFLQLLPSVNTCLTKSNAFAMLSDWTEENNLPFRSVDG